MNPGILTPPTQYATMPRGLLGFPATVPTIDHRAGFEPVARGSLLAWYDVSNAASRFQNSDGTAPAVSQNDPVGYLADLSGNGYHMRQTVNNSRPLLQVRSQNGLQTLLFDGLNDALVNTSPSFVNGLQWTVFAVVRLVNNATWSAGVIGSGRQGLTGEVATALQLHSIFVAAPQTRVIVGALARRNGTFAATISPVPSQFLIASGTTSIRANVQNPTDGVHIGSLRDSAGALGGNFVANINVGEILVYGRPLSLQEFVLAEAYLSSKWRIPLA